MEGILGRAEEERPPRRGERRSPLPSWRATTRRAELRALGAELRIVENRLSTPASSIDCVMAEQADLAVLGIRGRSGLWSPSLGTTAEHIVRDSPCSVLAVKPG